MSMLSIPSCANPSRALRLLGAPLRMAWTRLAAENRRAHARRTYRRELDELTFASDHILRDIGLSRDVLLRLPFAHPETLCDQDKSVALAEAAGEPH